MCSVVDGIMSVRFVFSMNLSALFCTCCSFLYDECEIVFSGMIGYSSCGRIIVLYSLLLLFVDRFLNLCKLFSVFMAMALRVVICGVMLRVENVRPNTVALFVYGVRICSFVMIGCVVSRAMLSVWNLWMFVCIFHLFSYPVSCSIACEVFWEITLGGPGTAIICVMSSAYCM